MSSPSFADVSFKSLIIRLIAFIANGCYSVDVAGEGSKMAMRLEKPILPDEADIRQAVRAVSLLRKDPESEHYVLGSSSGSKVEISQAAFHLLMNVLEEMSRGNAVLVVPIHAELTTQEAASLLNVSRPYLIKLLEQGKIKFQLKGRHRRIFFKDLMEYKQKAARESFEALSKLAAESEELGLGM